MKDIILSVITSWQVWVATVAVVVYISLVRFVGRLNSRASFRPAPAKKAKKQKAGAEAKGQPAAAAPGTSKTDELGLEESGGGGGGGDGVVYEEE